MTPTMNVKFLWNEPTYDSFELAVEASQKAVRTRQAESDNETLKHLSIIDYSMEKFAVEFLLSDKRILRIFIDGDSVTWHILDDRSLEAGRTRYSGEICLHLPGGEQMTWSPEELLGCRVNRLGVAIAPTETLVYLYVKGCAELMFGQMVDLTTNKRLLFYEEE